MKTDQDESYIHKVTRRNKQELTMYIISTTEKSLDRLSVCNYQII